MLTVLVDVVLGNFAVNKVLVKDSSSLAFFPLDLWLFESSLLIISAFAIIAAIRC